MEKNKIILEDCVSEIKELITSAQNKIDRLQLCSQLEQGGLSPDMMLVDFCINACQLDGVVLLKLREDDSWRETDLIQYQEQINAYKSIGAKQFVFGFIKDGKIDVQACRKIIKLLDGTQYIFHQAIDQTKDLEESIKVLIDLGFSRVITKGGQKDIMENLNTLKHLISKYQSQIEIVVAGATADNRSQIQSATGAWQFHGRKIK